MSDYYYYYYPSSVTFCCHNITYTQTFQSIYCLIYVIMITDQFDLASYFDKQPNKT